MAVASSTSTPDPVLAVIHFLAGRTSLDDRIGEVQGADPEHPDRARAPGRTPNITVEADGGRPEPADNRIIHPTILLTVRGKTRHEARRVSREVRDLFLPPDDITGLHETIDYADEDGIRWRVTFSGAREDAPMRYQPDERNIPSVIQSFQVTLHNDHNYRTIQGG